MRPTDYQVKKLQIKFPIPSNVIWSTGAYIQIEVAALPMDQLFLHVRYSIGDS